VTSDQHVQVTRTRKARLSLAITQGQRGSRNYPWERLGIAYNDFYRCKFSRASS